MIEAGILTAIAQRVASAAAAARPAHPLLVDGWAFGFVDAARQKRLAAFDDVFGRSGDALVVLPQLRTAQARTVAFAALARALAAEGALTAWRDELYAVAPAFGAPPALLVEWAAARYLGLHTYAAHANGLVGTGPSARMWLARRSPTKAIDPGLLDNLVGGGVAAGEAPLTALVREAWEEAGIGKDLAQRAKPRGTISIQRSVPDGFQHETIHAYDLALPADFTPANQDGEVVEHRLVDLPALAHVLAQDTGPDTVTLDATCVAYACLRRQLADAPR